MTAKRVIFALILLLILFLSSFFAWKIGKARGYSEGYSAPHPSDTTFVVDTHYVDRPVEVVKYVDRERPVYIAVHDTTRINDTTFVVLPREVKTYADSTYRAQVSGVQPSLDWIEVYQRTTTVVKTVTEYSDYTDVLSGFVDAGASYANFYVKTGFRFESRFVGPVNYTLKAGYEWSKLGQGGFMEAGLCMPLWKK